MTAVTLHVGTYAGAGGEGLYRLDYDSDTGFKLGEPLHVAANASFGAWSARNGLHYLVNEQTVGTLAAYRIVDGLWQQVGGIATGGSAPCHVALDPEERRAAVAHYASGSIALVELDSAGVPECVGAAWANQGRGPHARQDTPHMHCVQFSPDGRWLYAADLGTDQIVRFAVEGGAPLATAKVVYRAPPGSGPRHLLLHPRALIALLVSELASTVSVLDVRDDGLALRMQCSTVPDDFTEENLGGHVALNRAGTHAYVTNRGHDSVAVYRVDAAGGTI